MTHPPSSNSSYFVGIDVAKDKLDLARSDTGQILAFANDAAGIRKIVESLATTPPAVIAIESTGGLERRLLEALLDAKLPTALVNPRTVRYFAKGLGRQAKTDPIDAQVLMEYARRANPRLAQKRSENQKELDALVTCRRQLAQTRAMQMNQRQSTTSKAATKILDQVVRTLDQKIDTLDKAIAKLIESDDDFNSMDKLLRSVPGVGPVLSATLLGEMNELGTVNRRGISALAGVAPYNSDSGKHKGQRSISGGRKQVRSVLYMAAVTAMRHNPVIHAFTERMNKLGKPKKVQIVAAMRKLLGFLNVMIRERKSWDQLTVVKALAI
jgi:transposase